MNIKLNDIDYITILKNFETTCNDILQEAEIQKKEIDVLANNHISKIKKDLFIKIFDEEDCLKELEFWFHQMEQKCYQGGAGHRITWNMIPSQFSKNLKKLYPHYIDKSPHHWMCSFDDYLSLKLSAKLYVFCYLKEYKIHIDETASIAYWN